MKQCERLDVPVEGAAFFMSISLSISVHTHLIKNKGKMAWHRVWFLESPMFEPFLLMESKLSWGLMAA